MLNAIKTSLICALVFVFVTACTPNQTAMIENAKKAVVIIASEKVTERGDMGGLGTGFFVKENYIFTARHVISDAKNIKIALEKSDNVFDAEVVYEDAFSDVAVLRVKNWEEFKSKNDIEYLPIVQHDDLRPYINVYSIGHPWGLFFSVSKGIVSSPIRKKDSSPMWYIQTDARVFEGNSGGPLITEYGKVIGINDMMVAKLGGSYGLAIPMSVALKVVNDLEKYKEVRWATLGISLNKNVIQELDPEGAAKKAGLQVGDVIDELFTKDDAIIIDTAEQLISKMTTLDYSEKIRLGVKRDGNKIRFDITPSYKVITKEQDK